MHCRTRLILSLIAIPALFLTVTGCNNLSQDPPQGITNRDLGLQTGVGQLGAPVQNPDQPPNNAPPTGDSNNPPAIPKASN